jgi:hypothetical protein
MGTKLRPGSFDCYEKAMSDEPMFVLLARDPLAPILVRLWADLQRPLSDPVKNEEARMVAVAMETWCERVAAKPK